MYLYHGSNVAVINPKLINSKRTLDFGNAFYLTSDLEQAKRWAKLITNRRGEGIPTISVFEFKPTNEIKILKFNEPNYEWLELISINRKLEYYKNKHDIIIGPVANDNTMPVINLYLNGQYTKEEAIKRLLPQKLKDQYAFKTPKSLECLTIKEVIKDEEK